MADDRCKTEQECTHEPWCRIHSECAKGTKRRAPPLAKSFGYSLAMHVLQSDLYHHLDPVERAECDELIRRGMEGNAGVREGLKR